MVTLKQTQLIGCMVGLMVSVSSAQPTSQAISSRTLEHAFARYVSASKSKDLAAHCDVIPEPWSSAYRRIWAQKKEIREQHRALVNVLEKKFGEPQDAKQPFFDNEDLRERWQEISAPFFSANVTFQEARITKSENRKVTFSLVDLDGVTVDVRECVAFSARVKLSSGETTKIQEMSLLGMKIANEWKIAEEFFLTVGNPTDDLQSQIDQCKNVLKIYRNALAELNDGLYKARHEVQKVLSLELEDEFQLVRTLHVPVEAEEPSVQIDSELPQYLVLRVRARRETDERLSVELDGIQMSLEKAKSSLEELKRLAGDDAPRIVVDPEFKVWTNGLTDVLEALLDSGYAYDKVVLAFSKNGFSEADYKSVAKKFRGRLRLFARLPENAKNLARYEASPLNEVELSKDSATESELRISDGPLAVDITLPADPGLDVDVLSNDIPLAEIKPSAELKIEFAAPSISKAELDRFDPLTNQLLKETQGGGKVHLVWLLDRTPSMQQFRQPVLDRIGRIYQELRLVMGSGLDFDQGFDRQLLSSAISFSEQSESLTRRPSAMREAPIEVMRMSGDNSEAERTFSAIYEAAIRFAKTTREDKRRVVFVVVSDEAGDDQDQLERVLKLCRHHRILVFAIGAATPFGGHLQAKQENGNRGDHFQGPETWKPERLNLPFFDGRGDVSLPSGFGPFALSRLCHETGGRFFVSLPFIGKNERRHAEFHQKVSSRYLPDYNDPTMYSKAVSRQRSRQALLHAATETWNNPPQLPSLSFPASNEAEFKEALSKSQRATAVLEFQLTALNRILESGRADRQQETSPRWQAGYDLAMGRVLSMQARTKVLNHKLAKLRTTFQPGGTTPTLTLVPDQETSHSAMELAKESKVFLRRVIAEHPKTPWAWLAQRELDQPFVWTWSKTQ